MIVNILGHGFQWAEGNPNLNAQHVNVEGAINFHSVNFYCEQGHGFHGPNARNIVNGHGVPTEVANDLHAFPEHFVIGHMLAWFDIVPQQHDGNGPVYALPNIVHNLGGFDILRLRQVRLLNQGPLDEIQLAIMPINNTCISLSWLVRHIPEIVAEHQQFVGLPNDCYTYRWLVCRDFIANLNVHDNAQTLNNINNQINEMQVAPQDRLLWDI